MSLCRLAFVPVYLIALCGFVLSNHTNDGHSNGFSKFAAEFYLKSSKIKQDNIVISPYSTQSALLLLFMGADGDTADEISKAFDLYPQTRNEIADTFTKFHKSLEGKTLFKEANRIFIDKEFSLKPSFNEIATKIFQSEATKLDFLKSEDVVNVINQWVEEQTNNKIKELYKSSDFDSSIKMVLANAVYFKGEWKELFDEKDTRLEKFWNSETESVDVPTMVSEYNFKYGYFGELRLRTIELAYKDTDVTMMILLPLDRTGFADLERNLLNIDIFELSKNSSQTNLPLWLPKFKIETEIDLTVVLRELEIASMFTDKANFNELLEPSANLQLSKATHKAFIEIDEKGAEAAASTGFSGFVALPSAPKESIHVEHPFMYVIKSPQTILFMGSVRKF